MAQGDDEKLLNTVVSDIVHALTDAPPRAGTSTKDPVPLNRCPRPRRHVAWLNDCAALRPLLAFR